MPPMKHAHVEAPAPNRLDAYLPDYDAVDRQVYDVKANLSDTRRALRTYDVSTDMRALSVAWRMLSGALPAPPPKSTRLVQLRRLSDAAMATCETGLILGFIGKIWRVNALLRHPDATDFIPEAARSTDAACVVWLLEAVPGGSGRAQLRLSMRLRYPRRRVARWACMLYWHSVRSFSVMARLHLLRSIAQHTVKASH